MKNNEYTLKKTITGKVPDPEDCILKDAFGNKLKAPSPPNKKCKRCFGRGFIGLDKHTKILIPCRKCYPWKDV
jgi:hypothetical protein